MIKTIPLIFMASSLALGQWTPGDPIPVPTATASQPNPFVDAVDVSLSSDKVLGEYGQIWYDLDNSDPFDTSKANLYLDVPIPISATTVLRTVVCYQKADACSESASYTFTKDAPPTVTLGSPTSGQILRQGVGVNLSVSHASDPDGPVTSVRYYRKASSSTVWEELGEASTGPAFSFNWVPGSGTGSYLIHAIAYDQYGATGVSTDVPVILTLPNQAPVVSLTSPGNGMVYPNFATVSLSATASDPDAAGGSITKVEFYAGTNLLATVSSPPYTYDWSNVSAGSYVLTAKAYDNNSPAAVTTSSSVNILVEGNKPPLVAITAPADGAVYANLATINLAASASDQDLVGGGITKVEFYAGTTLLSTLTAPPYTYNWPNVPAGNYTLTAIAYDNNSPSATTTSTAIHVVVEANKPPKVTMNSPVDGASYPNLATIALGATASDQDASGGGITKVEFYAGTTLLSTLTAPPYTYNWPSVSSGSYVLTAKAYDNNSPPAIAISSPINIVVAANKSPKVAITSPANGTFYYSPASDSIRVSASDSDGSISKVEFYNGANLEGTDFAPPYVLGKINMGDGVYNFTAKAFDNLGASTVSAVVTLTVSTNKPPNVTAGKDTTLVLPTASVTLNGFATDPEGAGLTYQWTAPAGVTLSNANIRNPYATVTGGVGTYTLSLKATDLGSPAASATDSMKITLHKKPTITSSLSQSGPAKQLFTYVFTADGFPVPNLSAYGMPSWLTWVSATATLTGTPPAPGSFTVYLGASNSAGNDFKTLSITISDALTKPTINSPINAFGKLGEFFTYTITAYGSSPITLAAASPLPAGITAVGPTLSGTPTSTGITNVTLTATNAFGSDSKNLTITITSDPKLTLNLPDSLVVFDKDPATFTVSATGFPAPTFRWEYAGISNVFGPIGSNSPTYSLPSVSPSSAGSYHVIVQNGAGPDVTSKTCRLIVKPLPLPIVMVLQPVPQTITLGKPVTFKARATGDAPLKYQWFRGAALATAAPSASDSNFTIPAVALTDANVYSVRVTNGFTDLSKPSTYAQSDTARLRVTLPKLPKPRATILSGPFYPEIKVRLLNDTSGVLIYYTLDNGNPTTSSLKYTTGDTIKIGSTTTLKAIAMKTGFQNSDVMVETYTYTLPGQVVKPEIQPPGPTFKNSMAFTLSTSTPLAELWYTDDGSSPTGTKAKRYPGSAVTINATTTIIAIAKRADLINSDTLMKTYTLEKPLSKVLSPTATPAGPQFPLLGKVTLSSATDSAVIYYTTDSTQPDTSSTKLVYNQTTGITLTKTTNLRAVATRPGFINSDFTAWKYNLTPTLVATPGSGSVFDGSTTITLTPTPANAIIRYTTDGTKPTSSSFLFPVAGLQITETTTLSTLTTLDGITSEATFSYTKKGGQLAPPVPVTLGNTTTFKDSLLISLLATPGSDIYYTLNGDLPNTGSRKFRDPFWIDTTTTVQAIATLANFETSKILYANYTLIPEAPTITPRGGAYSSAQKITMTTTSQRSTIFYTLDGSDPTPENRLTFKAGDSVLISKSTNVKAIAVAGNMASPIQAENYSIFGVKTALVLPGENYFLEGGYVITNPGGHNAVVEIRLADADSLKVKGFDGVQYSIGLTVNNINGISPAPTFPNMVLTRSSSDKRSLYKVEPSGLVYFISGQDSVVINEPGNYFMGIDISPPVITYLNESIDPGDSTSVSFTVEDNIANLIYDLKRNDDPKLNINQQSLLSPARLKAKLKHPPGILKPLTLQLIVSDYQLSSYFPKDGRSSLSLSQSMGELKGPPLWKVGLNPKFPYDLISIPMNLVPPLTLADLKKTQADVTLQGVRWSNSVATYLPMDPSEELKSGQSYWIATHTPFKALSLANAKTSAQGPGKFSVRLAHGWNQVANPHLENLYWPITRSPVDQYLASPIKGLWGYNASSASYQESEILEPWRGYFVYSYLDETTVELSNEPVRTVAMAKGSSASGALQLCLGWGSERTLRLGAASAASDGLGLEDEMVLPRGMSGDYLQAIRQGKALASDWVHMQPDAVLQWKVAMGGNDDSLPPLRILEQALPEDYETWAVSKSRSMKFKLAAGQSIPSSGLPKDTLFIYSGPRNLLARMQSLQELSSTAPQLGLSVITEPGGFTLQLAIPSRSTITATLWGLDGTKKGSFAMGPIAEGTYRFGYATDFQGRNRDLSAGIYFMTVDIHGKGVNSRLSRKICLNR